MKRHVFALAFALGSVFAFSSGSARADGPFWIEATAGYSYVNLTTFGEENFLPTLESTTDTGWTVGGAAGLRLWAFTIGARGNFARHPDFNLSSAMIDLGLRLPLPLIEPFVRAGFGYAWLGTGRFREEAIRNADIAGFAAELGVGVDIALPAGLSLGVGVDGGLLFLSRDDVEGACEGDGCGVSIDLAETGRSYGVQVRPRVMLTYRF